MEMYYRIIFVFVISCLANACSIAPVYNGPSTAKNIECIDKSSEECQREYQIKSDVVESSFTGRDRQDKQYLISRHGYLIKNLKPAKPKQDCRDKLIVTDLTQAVGEDGVRKVKEVLVRCAEI